MGGGEEARGARTASCFGSVRFYVEFYKHSKDFIITYKALSPNDSTFYDGEGVGRGERGSLEKPGESPLLRYLPRSVKFLKVPPLRAILTLIVNLEERLRKDEESGCWGVGREGRGGGGKGEGEGQTGRNPEKGRGKGQKQRSRAGVLRSSPRPLLFFLKRLFKNVQITCSRVFEKKQEQAGFWRW